jgi:hypothetical protein
MKRKYKKYLVGLLVCFLVVWGCEEFFRRMIGGFAGSYPFVEYWEIRASEREVIEAIKEMKREHPDLQPPDQSVLVAGRGEAAHNDTGKVNEIAAYLKDTSKTSTDKGIGSDMPDYWLYIDFFYNDTKQVVHTWTRPSEDSTSTTFAFVGLNTIGYPQGYKLINKDFWYLANKREINKFKKRILEKLEEQLEKRNPAYVPL